jgi:hypothetical protein
MSQNEHMLGQLEIQPVYVFLYYSWFLAIRQLQESVFVIIFYDDDIISVFLGLLDISAYTRTVCRVLKGLFNQTFTPEDKKGKFPNFYLVNEN